MPTERVHSPTTYPSSVLNPTGVTLLTQSINTLMIRVYQKKCLGNEKMPGKRIEFATKCQDIDGRSKHCECRTPSNHKTWIS